MHPVTIVLGCGSAVAFVVAAFSPEWPARFMAAALVAVWGVSNIAWLHDDLAGLAYMDFAIGCLAIAFHRQHPVPWRTLFLWMAGAQLGLHALYELSDKRLVVPYIWALNITFAVELVAVASSGGPGIVGWTLSRLRRLRAAFGLLAPSEEVSRGPA